MSLQTCVAIGTTTLENLREKNSILLTTSTGVALLGASMSLYEAKWVSDEEKTISLSPSRLLGNCGIDSGGYGLTAVVPTLSIEVEPSKNNELSLHYPLQDLLMTSLDTSIHVKIINEEAKTTKKSQLNTTITGPPILPILGCILQHETHTCVALYRKGFNCIHLFYYCRDGLSDKSIDNESTLTPFDPPTITLPAPIHGVASLHDYGAFIIATCERSCSTLYMKPDTTYEVKLHSYIIIDVNARAQQVLKYRVPSTAFNIKSVVTDHACQAFSMIMKFATDPKLSTQEKASLISAMSCVYDSSLKACCNDM